MITPKKVTPTKWSDVKTRIAAAAAKTAAEGRTVKVAVKTQGG